MKKCDKSELNSQHDLILDNYLLYNGQIFVHDKVCLRYAVSANCRHPHSRHVRRQLCAYILLSLSICLSSMCLPPIPFQEIRRRVRDNFSAFTHHLDSRKLNECRNTLCVYYTYKGGALGEVRRSLIFIL